MKTRITITEINHEDLVELLSTALYGSAWLGCDYRVGYNKETVKFEENDTCFEDRAARCLLQGKYIEFLDRLAEGEDEAYGNLPHYWDEDEYCMVYKVTLKDIEAGLARMLECKGWYLECATAFVQYENGDFDYTYADVIIQFILFGEQVYS